MCKRKCYNSMKTSHKNTFHKLRKIISLSKEIIKTHLEMKSSLDLTKNMPNQLFLCSKSRNGIKKENLFQSKISNSILSSFNKLSPNRTKLIAKIKTTLMSDLSQVPMKFVNRNLSFNISM